jgi:hypothetical protein
LVSVHRHNRDATTTLGRLSESLCPAADTLWGLCELRDQMVGEALGRMAHNLTAATDTLASLLGDENPLVRLRAARRCWRSRRSCGATAI